MLITLLLLLWIFVSLFLILIILLQRGKGGGLAGALGGAGGSSAFGTKAGDVFTRITVGVFAFWLLLAMVLVWSMKTPTKFPGGMAAGKNAKGAKSTGTEVSDSTKKENDDLEQKLKKALDDSGAGKKDDSKKGEIPSPPPKTSGAETKKTGSDPKKEPSKTEAPKADPTKPAPKADAPKTDAPKTDAKSTTPTDAKTPTPPVKGDGKKS